MGREWAILYPMMLCWTWPVKDELMCLSPREQDVAAIDVNMGCPKEYSTKVSFLSVTHQLIRPPTDLRLISGWSLADIWLISGLSMTDLWLTSGCSLADQLMICDWSLADLLLISDCSLAGRDGSCSSLRSWQDRGGEYFSQTTRQTLKVVVIQLSGRLSEQNNNTVFIF